MLPFVKFSLIWTIALLSMTKIEFGLATSIQYAHGAVVSDGHECADIGTSILKKGGSAVDSAIATMFCEGVALPASTGLGGGFLMTIYIRENQTAITLNAREVAPLASSENMYGSDSQLSYKGGLSIAVPGELRGYWYAHQKYGVLPWAELVQPTIDLCRNGHKVTSFLETTFSLNEWQIRKDPGLREVFLNPDTNTTYREGDYVKRPNLAKTLETIARDGADALYDGILTKLLVEDIQRANGIITEDDLKTYRPIWMKPLVSQLFGNQSVHTVSVPGSGPILIFILNILNNFLDTANVTNVKNWQKIVESFKYAYAKRSEMGDSDFVDVKGLIQNLTSPTYAKTERNKITFDKTFETAEHYGANFSTRNNHGTANIVVLAPNGDAVSVTGTINQIFGSGILSTSTGIILNDQMDDFASPGITNQFGLPPSPANFIRPKKHPLSSMSPSIVTDENGDVILVIGAAGGTKITTAIALTVMLHLWFGEELSSAIKVRRLHHQLIPMRIDHEENFEEHILEHLSSIGHKLHVVPPPSGFAAITGISKKNGIINGSFDPRRGGSISLVT